MQLSQAAARHAQALQPCTRVANSTLLPHHACNAFIHSSRTQRAPRCSNIAQALLPSSISPSAPWGASLSRTGEHTRTHIQGVLPLSRTGEHICTHKQGVLPLSRTGEHTRTHSHRCSMLSYCWLPCAVQYPLLHKRCLAQHHLPFDAESLTPPSRPLTGAGTVAGHCQHRCRRHPAVLLPALFLCALPSSQLACNHHHREGASLG